MSTYKEIKKPSLVFSSFRDLDSIFGPPPILSGEDPEAYYELGQALWNARPPEDFIQATRINDIAYLLWEGSRLRRLKVKLIEASKVEGAKRLIGRLDANYHAGDFWSAWVLGDQETIEYVNQILTAAGLDQDAIVAQTIETIVDTLEALERQSAQFEARRLVTIRDLDHYSDNSERRLERSHELKKQIEGHRPKKARPKNDADLETAPQLPLGYKAAE